MYHVGVSQSPAREFAAVVHHRVLSAWSFSSSGVFQNPWQAPCASLGDGPAVHYAGIVTAVVWIQCISSPWHPHIIAVCFLRGCSREVLYAEINTTTLSPEVRLLFLCHTEYIQRMHRQSNLQQYQGWTKQRTKALTKHFQFTL